MSANEMFIGLWKLVSFTKKSPRGKVTSPYGEDAIGHLSYGKDGYMFASVMAANRPEMGVSLDEIINAGVLKKLQYAVLGVFLKLIKAWGMHFSYCGRYEIVENTVVHHVEIGSFVELVGSELVRSYEFNENRLTLRFEDTFGAKLEFVWERD